MWCCFWKCFSTWKPVVQRYWKASIWLKWFQNRQWRNENCVFWHSLKKNSTSSLYYRMFLVCLCLQLLGQWGSVAPARIGIAGTVDPDSSSFFSHQRCKVELCRLEHLIKEWASDRRLKEKTATRASLTLNAWENLRSYKQQRAFVWIRIFL